MDKSDRLRPVIVQTRKSPEQLVRITNALARLEKTDGMRLSQLIVEAASEIPRDASVVVIVSQVNLENAIALGGLSRQGYSVEAIVNCYSEEEFAAVSAPFVGRGYRDKALKRRASVAIICEKQILR